MCNRTKAAVVREDLEAFFSHQEPLLSPPIRKSALAGKPVPITTCSRVLLTGANLTGVLPPSMFSALPDLTILFLGTNPGELILHHLVSFLVPKLNGRLLIGLCSLGCKLPACK